MLNKTKGKVIGNSWREIHSFEKSRCSLEELGREWIFLQLANEIRSRRLWATSHLTDVAWGFSTSPPDPCWPGLCSVLTWDNVDKSCAPIWGIYGTSGLRTNGTVQPCLCPHQLWGSGKGLWFLWWCPFPHPSDGASMPQHLTGFLGEFDETISVMHSECGSPPEVSIFFLKDGTFL